MAFNGQLPNIPQSPTVPGQQMTNPQQYGNPVQTAPIGAGTQQQSYQTNPGVVQQNQQTFQHPTLVNNNQPSGMGAEWDIIFNSNGEMELAPRGGQQQQTAQIQQQVNNSNYLNPAQALQTQQQQQPNDPAVTKIAQLEQNVQYLSQALTAMLQQQQAGGTGGGAIQQQQQAPQEIDFNQPGALMNAVNQAVGQAVQSALKPHMETLGDMRTRIDFSTTAAMFGQDFTNKLPIIKQLVDSDPKSNLTFEGAYRMIKAVENAIGQGNRFGANGDSIVQNPQQNQFQQLNPQQLVQRAQQIATDGQNGVNNFQTQGGQPQINNVGDAFNLAWSQLTSGQS